MRFLTTLILLVAFPSMLWAQDPAPAPPPDPPPLIEQAIIIQTEEITLSRELTNPPGTTPQPAPSPYARKLFWLGVGVALSGAILTGLSVTRERESDLSEEHPNTRLNVHLAPCGTDPADTTLPIADCKVNTGLLYFGLGLTGAGTGLAWYAVSSAHPSPQLQYKVRF